MEKSFPTLKRDNQMKRGDYNWAENNRGLAYYKWKDKKLISYFLFILQIKKIFVNRKEKDESTLKVLCPLALKNYNSNVIFVLQFLPSKKRLSV